MDRSKRSWTPNIQNKKLVSKLLDVTLKIPVTTKTIRCLDKCGGLDEYLLTTHPKRVASKSGEDLKRLIIPQWEKENLRPYDRRQLVYETRLIQRMKKGKVTSEEATALINKSRLQIAKRRKWLSPVPLLPTIQPEASPSSPISDSSSISSTPQEDLKLSTSSSEISSSPPSL